MKVTVDLLSVHSHQPVSMYVGEFLPWLWRRLWSICQSGKGGKRRRRGKAESRRWCHELCKGTASAAAAPYKAMVVVGG